MISTSLDSSNFNTASVQLLQEKQTASQYMPIISFTEKFSQVFQLNAGNYKLKAVNIKPTDTTFSVELNVVT